MEIFVAGGVDIFDFSSHVIYSTLPSLKFPWLLYKIFNTSYNTINYTAITVSHDSVQITRFITEIALAIRRVCVYIYQSIS